MELKAIDIVCDQGSAEVNEDIAQVVGRAAYVIDGATGLNGKNLVSDKSDAYWFVNFWDKFLIKNINRDLPIKEIVREGIVESYRLYLELIGDEKPSSIDFPSASMAIVRLDGKELEYFILGDCSIVSKKGAELNFYMDKRLHPLDNDILKKMKQLTRKKGLSYEDIKSILKDDIIRNRLKKNTSEGYWVLEFEPEAVDKAVEGCIKICSNIEIALMSDGFAAIVDKYHLVTTTEAFENGIKIAIDKLRKFEEEDRNVKKIPRFKVMDDASCVHLGFVDK